MKNKDFYRFAIMLSTGQAQTFNKNLSKMIKLVLFDAAPNNLTPLQIRNKINEKYSIETTEEEISEILKRNKDKSFENRKGSNGYLYTIKAKEIQKLKENFENRSFDKILNKFVSYIKDKADDISSETVKDLINRYIYYVFNNDKNTLLALINNEKNINEIDITDSFSLKEKELINMFVMWENREKDEAIYNIVSLCFEYCMMTVKKDNASYKDVFRGNKFYLDANIIFRLAGFNNEERKEVIYAFIKKCKENDIVLVYTNFTKDEINKTISYHVSNIEKMEIGEPISYEAMKVMSPNYENRDFYYMYSKWVKDLGNDFRNFKGFKTYLNKKIEEVLREFKFEAVQTYNTRHRERKEIFNEYKEDLKEYKESHRYSSVRAESVIVDVENFLYVLEKNKGYSHTSFTDKKNYIISADHYLVDWEKKILPSTVPTVILPSIWYSILLKYSGRTDDDYKSFTQFLKLPITTNDDNRNLKNKILCKVLALDESADIKEDIIFNINEKLQEDGSVDDLDNTLQESYEYITERKIKKALEEKSTKYEERQNELIEHFNKEQDCLKETSYQKGLEEGKNSGRDDVYKELCKERIKKNKIIISLIVLGSILATGYLCIKLFNICYNEEKTLYLALKETLNMTSSFTPLLSFIGMLFGILHNKIGVFSTNDQEVLEKIKEEYAK